MEALFSTAGGVEGGLLAEWVDGVLHLVNGFLDLGDLPNHGQALLQILFRLLDLAQSLLEGTYGLAESGADFGKFPAAKDKEGDRENNEQFRCSESKHGSVGGGG